MRRIGLPNLSMLLLAVGAIAAAIAIPASASSDGKADTATKRVATTVVQPATAAKAAKLRSVGGLKVAEPLPAISKRDATSLLALPARGHGGHAASASGGAAHCHKPKHGHRFCAAIVSCGTTGHAAGGTAHAVPTQLKRTRVRVKR